MGTILAGMMTFFVVFAFNFNTAGAEELPRGFDFEFEDKILESESLTKGEWFYEIKIGKSLYRVEHIPHASEMRKTLGFDVPAELREKILAQGGELPHMIDPLEAYNSLNEREKLEFEHIRLQISRGVSRVLHYTQGVMAAGILTKDSLRYIYTKLRGREVERSERTFRERKQALVESLLKSLNHRLFYQAPLVLKQNEFGFAGSIGALAISGVREKGRGGLLELGFSIGYNKEKKALVFELIMNPEKFEKSVAAVTVASINLKAGIFLANVQAGKETATRHGASFYPPMIPGYMTTSSNYGSFGFSSGVGFPPPPLADFFTFSNHSEATKLVRITISPLVPGFVRIGVGDLKPLAGKLFGSVLDAYKYLEKKFGLHLQPRSCQRIF